jgi:IS30 family transposase
VKKRGTKSKWKKDDLIAAVIKMRLEEMSSVKTIIDFLMSDDIGMSKTTAYQYLAWAREEIKDQYDLMNPSKIEEAIGQYEEALERARQIKDWRLWNDLKKEMNKIQGVYAKQTMDITSNNKDFTPNEIIIKIIENGNISEE